MQSSNPTQTKLTELKTFLSEQGINFDELMFVSSGSEQVIGEYVGESDGRLTLLNPLRFFRIQRISQAGNMEVTFMIGSYDMMNEGTLTLIPQALFKLQSQPIETQLAYGSLLAQYVDNRAKNRAADAGLVLPQLVRSPR